MYLALVDSTLSGLWDEVVNWLKAILNVVLALLPDSPFIDQSKLPQRVSLIQLPVDIKNAVGMALNFVPLDTIYKVTMAWSVAIFVYYIYKLILAWSKMDQG